MDINRFQRKILSWYRENKRDLPWRHTENPYKILVSEVMLQQTQVSRVIPKYKEFLKEFPSLEKLAKAPSRKLLEVWAGLGYWKRALNLKDTAKILRRIDQTNPSDKSYWTDPEFLETLPGIGHYTARALACFAFGNQETFLDTNIRRVYLHFFFPKKKNVSDKEILPVAQKAVYHLSYGRRKVATSPREWHYALFDYGAMVLKNKQINKRSKHYTKQSKFEGSFRSFRTKVVKFLLAQKGNRASHAAVEAFLKNSSYPAKEIISSLLKDKLIKTSATQYYL